MSVAMPTVTTEIRFAAGASSTGFELGSAVLGLSTLGSAVTYTDVSSDVRSVSINRGKQRELDEFAAGTCSVVLDNRDRDYDPLYTSSPYYVSGASQVKAGRWMRIKATHPTTGTTYDLWKGTIREWEFGYSFPSEATAMPRGTDFLEDLSQTNVSTSTTSALSGTVAAEILNAANILPRALDAGQGTMGAQTLTASPALTALQTLTKSEGGPSAAIYVDETGDVKFEDRNSLSTNTRSNTSQATFGTAALPVDSIELELGSSLVKNAISLTRVGGSAQTRTSTTSQDEYGIRSFVLTGLYNNTDSDVDDLAGLYLAAFEDDELRVRRVTLNPRASADLMTQALSRQIRDRITISYSPPQTSGSSTVTQEMFISGIAHEFSAQNMKTTFTLESTAGRNPWWTLGSGALDTTTKLGF